MSSQARSEGAASPVLAPLPLEEWEETKETLHRWAQIVGKVRLAAAPKRNHWWHAPLYVSAWGLTTRLIPYTGRGFAIEFDFVDHRLVVSTSDGGRDGFALIDGLTVATFHQELFERLAALGIGVEIVARPFDLEPATPFAEDEAHARHDAAYVERWWRILVWTVGVFEEFAGRFAGKTSPVHLFWHSFDLALTRFSGRRAPERAGVDPVTQEAYSHEVVSVGFWAGDKRVRAAAFYAYAAPEPPGLAQQPLRPDSATWSDTGNGSLALLMYEDVRGMADPRAALLDFLQSAYEAGSRTAGWDESEASAVSPS
ncbi:MAG: DUF5996 family protein [Chloroflexota bacterium]|nr:DUF5996 family protein [Chloroflexota bacterium]